VEADVTGSEKDFVCD